MVEMIFWTYFILIHILFLIFSFKLADILHDRDTDRLQKLIRIACVFLAVHLIILILLTIVR